MIHVYYKTLPEKDKYIKHDRLLINLIKKIFGKAPIGGLNKVFINLIKGFDKLSVEYSINTKFEYIKSNEPVLVLGIGKSVLNGYNLTNKIIAGIGLMTYPVEWLSMREDYPIVKYLQHSEWANNIYKPYFKEICEIWPVGIDTDEWMPEIVVEKKNKVLIYNKTNYNLDDLNKDLINPIKVFLNKCNFEYEEIIYGKYKSSEYRKKLKDAKFMIYLSEHESQGIAYQECLSLNIPILAWDQGILMDPNYSKYKLVSDNVSSVPYFDHTCGEKFKTYEEFVSKFELLLHNINSKKYKPREYILNNLTLEKSTCRILEIIKSVYPNY